MFVLFVFFFFNDTATTEIYTLSLHDALPIWSHTLSMWSSDAETACSPSGVTATAQTGEWPSSVRSGRAVSRSHTFSVWSRDAETAPFPSGVIATAETGEWPSSVRCVRPVARSHTFSVRSRDAETARLPSGVTAIPL